MKLIIVLSIGVMTLFTSGCATIVRGTKQPVSVSSTPSNAEVVVSNGMRGVTPVTFTLPRNESVQITVSKQGYKPQSFNLHPKFSLEGAVTSDVGNILMGGLIGMGVDAVTGAAKELDSNSVFAELIAENDPDPVTKIIEGVVITEGKSKSPLNENQSKSLEEKIKEINPTAKVVEWGNPYKVKSLTGLSSNTYVAARVKISEKYSIYECMINSDGQLYKIRETPWGDINRPWDGKIRTEIVTLN